MSKVEVITGSLLRDSMISAANVLNMHKKEVDELNIFPVPDGDTGTNMSMTMQAAARELARLDNPTATVSANTASSALLRGARGNSGVILSLLFRGFAKGLKDKPEATGADLAHALTLGVEAAYKAVMKPTEGTILTVAREAAAKGTDAVHDDNSASHVWTVICQESHESLARTPDLLPVLKTAGVVDAGGQGLVIIFEAMKDVFEGGSIVEDGEHVEISKPISKPLSAVGAFEMDIKFPYCTEYIVLRNPKIDRDPLRLRAYLESIGDSVVVVDDKEIIKVHVHTDDPGKALSEGVKYGAFETVKIENMRIQHENAAWVPEDADDVPEIERAEPENEFGFVAVAAGSGVETLFTDLGCDKIVSGGQTMNPSTDDILHAIQATPAKNVFVLPNNKNIILSSEQAALLADRKVHVLQTRTIPQGIAAMLEFDPESSVEDNLLNMTHASDQVSSGSVTFAARNSDVGGKKIKEGEILALENGKVTFTDVNIKEATVKLVKNLIASRKLEGKEINFITLLYGEDVSHEEAEEVREAVQNRAGSSVDVTVIYGAQPVYYYLISIE